MSVMTKQVFAYQYSLDYNISGTTSLYLGYLIIIFLFL